jgi:hypothetical protein
MRSFQLLGPLAMCVALGNPTRASAAENCNEYDFMTGESGVAGHAPWFGHVNLKTMRWEFKHPGGGYVQGTVKMIMCTRDRISYQTYDEGQSATNICVGSIDVNQASGKCNSDRTTGDAFFRFRLLRQ